MIKQIYIDGKPKDIETKIATDKFLKELEMHELEFIVGIDYAHKNSKDYTAISHYETTFHQKVSI